MKWYQAYITGKNNFSNCIEVFSLSSLDISRITFFEKVLDYLKEKNFEPFNIEVREERDHNDNG